MSVRIGVCQSPRFIFELQRTKKKNKMSISIYQSIGTERKNSKTDMIFSQTSFLFSPNSVKQRRVCFLTRNRKHNNASNKLDLTPPLLRTRRVRIHTIHSFTSRSRSHTHSHTVYLYRAPFLSSSSFFLSLYARVSFFPPSINVKRTNVT